MDWNNTVKLVTYNLAMGRDKRDRMLDRGTAFCEIAAKMSDLYKTNEKATWFFCVQEIWRKRHRGPVDGFQVENLQFELRERTGIEWYKHSTTNPKDDHAEAVAVFSNAKLTKVQRWTAGINRPAVAVKANLGDSSKNIWVIAVHPIAPERDKDGCLRREYVDSVIDKVKTFDSAVPVVVAGDFNCYDKASGTFSNDAEKVDPEKLFEYMVGRLTKEGFTRGLKPGQQTCYDATFHSWNDVTNADDGTWGILDYIFVREAEACTAGPPTVWIGGNPERASKTGYVSDHLALQMTITFN